MTALLHSSPVLFVSALLYHITRLVSFRHDGLGLPANTSPVVGVLVVLYLALQPLRAYFFVPELNWALGIAGSGLLVGLMYWLSRSSRLRGFFPGYLLLNIGIDLLAVAGAQLFATSLDALRLTLEVWGLVAFTVFFWRASRPRESA